MMTITRRDSQRHTYDEYLTWPEDGLTELIDGVAYVREPPAPAPIHQAIVGELYHQIRTALEGTSSRVYVAPLDVRLPNADETDEKIETVVQPDVLIVRDRYRIDRRGLRGAPDWLAEVLSPGTAGHDLLCKIPVYERAGVPEVWLLYPTDRKVTLYQLDGRLYGRPAIIEMKGQTALTAVPNVTIDWDRLLKQLE